MLCFVRGGHHKENRNHFIYGTYVLCTCVAKRKFNRESLTKMTAEQKKTVLMNVDPDIQQPFDFDSNTCVGCLRKFKNPRGLSIHVRACKGERAEEAKIKGLEPMFLKWEVSQGKVAAKDKKKWRDGIRIWMMKRMKLELNLGLAAENPQDRVIEDDAAIHEVLIAAGKTIVPCLLGNHVDCARYSSGCGGDHAATDYKYLPSKLPLTEVPRQTESWLNSIVDAVLGCDALKSLIVNGRKATTSLVESVHREIRLAVPKGRTHRKNETALIKSGT